MDTIRWPNEQAFYNWYTTTTGSQRAKFYNALRLTQAAAESEHVNHTALQDEHRALQKTHERMATRANKHIQKASQRITELEETVASHDTYLPGTNIRSLNDDRTAREGTIETQQT